MGCYKLISVTDTDVTEVTQAANEVDYANAKASCEGLATDGKLAGPKTTTIFDELNALNTGSLEYWVGLDDSTTEGTYTFSDGTSFTLTGGTIGTSDATWSTTSPLGRTGSPRTTSTSRRSRTVSRW